MFPRPFGNPELISLRIRSEDAASSDPSAQSGCWMEDSLAEVNDVCWNAEHSVGDRAASSSMNPSSFRNLMQSCVISGEIILILMI
jgi:hypothetical protein